jgi:hypothetical protein
MIYLKSYKKKNLVFIIIINSIILSTICSAQIIKTINVKFELGAENVDFTKKIKLVLKVNNNQIEPLMFINGFVVPDFKGAEYVDIYFTYDNKSYAFTNTSVSKFETDWVFGILKKTTDKTIEKEYYLKFIPRNGDLVTIVNVKIKK